MTGKFKAFWPLVKSLQTGLLLSTGIAGAMSTHLHQSAASLLGVAGSLFLSIGGSTILNMWYDHDIDTVMDRTHNRPLASGKISQQEALRLGLVLSAAGVAWAVALKPLFG